MEIFLLNSYATYTISAIDNAYISLRATNKRK